MGGCRVQGTPGTKRDRQESEEQTTQGVQGQETPTTAGVDRTGGGGETLQNQKPVGWKGGQMTRL